MDEPSKKYVIHWFRKGLRLHDNPALCEAFKGASTFRCVYILDPWFAGVSQVGINKWRFLLQCLEDLDSSLRKVNSRLFVIRGQPTDVFPRLFKEWNITTLSFEEDPEPFGKERDAAISAMAKEAGVEVIVRMSHTLFNLQKIITENNGTPPLTFKRFQSILKTIGPPTKPVETVTLTTIGTARTPIIENDHDDNYGVPSLEELDYAYTSQEVGRFKKWDPRLTPHQKWIFKLLGCVLPREWCFDIDGLKPSLFHGGETEALLRLDRHLERKYLSRFVDYGTGKTLQSAEFLSQNTEMININRMAWVASFEKPKMTSQSLLPSQTTISPYLKFGCLSPRLFYWKLNDLYRRVKKKSDPPLSLHGQLLWREFFYLAATNNPKFDRMVGNPICVQVPWDKNKEALAKWAEGKTGFPWIDAIMIQLREVGWIHHLARHSVACFLTRGDLWISWEEGMKVFDELLLDADWSVNAGMWLWLSCSSFFQQFLNCYCPVGFGKRADPTGDFIRHYIPQLKGFHPKYIYEPWTAPHEVQVAAKCIIGKDYPQPMVDHNEVSRQNMERMKQVYQILAMRASGVSVITKTLTDDTVSKHPHSRISYATSCSNHISGNKPSKAAILLGGDSMSKLSHNSDEDNTGNSTSCDQI